MARQRKVADDGQHETSIGPGGETHQQVPAQGDHAAAAAHLTTNQGIRVSDNQNSLKAGARGPALLEDFVLREKIFHFDHERIPERIVHARGSAAHGIFDLHRRNPRADPRRAVPAEGQADPGVHPLLDRRGRRRLGRHAARRARLRGQILHRRGQLGPRRQQHPGVLHPGRDQVSRPDPCGEDGGRSRLSAGGFGARHVLGFRLADAGIDAHDHVGDVGPHPAALAADDGGLRRPHLPPGQRGREIDVRQVPLEAGAEACSRPAGTRR